MNFKINVATDMAANLEHTLNNQEFDAESRLDLLLELIDAWEEAPYDDEAREMVNVALGGDQDPIRHVVGLPLMFFLYDHDTKISIWYYAPAVISVEEVSGNSGMLAQIEDADLKVLFYRLTGSRTVELGQGVLFGTTAFTTIIDVPKFDPETRRGIELECSEWTTVDSAGDDALAGCDADRDFQNVTVGFQTEKILETDDDTSEENGDRGPVSNGEEQGLPEPARLWDDLNVEVD